MTKRDLNVAFIQQGARRSYIYARQLEEEGLLSVLVADAAFAEGAAGGLARLARLCGAKARAGLARRTVQGVPGGKLRSSVLPNLVEIASALVRREWIYPWTEAALAWRFRNDEAILTADVVVNYQGNGGSLLERAKDRGARIVTDFIITPAYLEVEHAERARWPGWEAETTSPALIEQNRARIERLVRLSDLYLCPSQTVARDLAAIPGFDPVRVRINPYGVSGVLLRPAATVRGRVLFAGAAGLRKGLPYLAEAARILADRGAGVEIVVAGPVTRQVRERPETNALTFLGMLGPHAMADAFASADVFCLPSLAEGSATSIFEAMANGLPVVTTPSSGSVVTDGLEGFVAPERDAGALADAIQRIVSDRDLRSRMSAAAAATAAAYDDAACARRFIAAVREAGAMR
ncbi:MAG: glycosyltransferase family 4 protein [Beijerinckiaceae bacterium]|nr:glycosyltransferase family 4 protein [Beijerinckiaceae bacterium]